MVEQPGVQVEDPPQHRESSAIDELSYRLRQQRLAADFGYFALGNDDLSELLQEASRVAADGLNTEFAKVLQHLGDGRGFLVVAGVGWREGLVGSAVVGDDLQSPAGYAFHTDSAVISNHLEHEQRFRTPKMLVEHRIERAINVIIKSDGIRYGVLEVDSRNAGKFEEADIAFLESFAVLLASAIRRGLKDAKLKESERRLQEAVSHQRVLTQEVSHRVKNSLAIVGGLLAMQSRVSTNDEVKRALSDARNRVHTIAAVHDRLWKHQEVRTVNLREFLSDLCAELSNSAGGHTVSSEAYNLEIVTDQAITIGLLVNELVTNAFKYAFGAGKGHVAVTLEAAKNNRYLLIVADDGCGLPDDFDAKGPDSLGLKLISSLSKQLSGEVSWRSEKGTTFALSFIPKTPAG
jgi:two-component sensor histidine kinase